MSALSSAGTCCEPVSSAEEVVFAAEPSSEPSFEPPRVHAERIILNPPPSEPAPCTMAHDAWIAESAGCSTTHSARSESSVATAKSSSHAQAPRPKTTGHAGPSHSPAARYNATHRPIGPESAS